MERVWYDTSEAYKLLDLKSVYQLRRLRSSGRLGRVGYHYRVVSSKRKAARPTYQFHVENCAKTLTS